MKKLILFFIILSCLSAAVFGQDICGDVDFDGEVTILDATLISQYYVSKPDPPDILFESLADVNRDGSVSITDAVLVARYYVGLVPDLDCCFEDPAAMDDVKNAIKELPVTFEVLDNDIAGESLTIIDVTDPGNGTAIIVNDKIMYTSDTGFTGTDSFIYTVEDSNYNTDVAMVNVIVIEPIAVDDSAFTGEGTGITIDVLANDLDENIQLIDVSGPAHGMAEINTDKIDYTPDSGFIGIDTFIYTIDYAGKCNDIAVITVTITDRLVNLSFPDPALQNCIYNSDCTFACDLKELVCPDQNIENLIGIEQCICLEKLVLTNNNISDVSPLADLEFLKVLDLEGNTITDISSLAAISSLETLMLANNTGIIFYPIDILNSLTQLSYLDLNNTGIYLVSTVSSLPKLETLIISNNQLIEFDLFSQLQQLVALDLTNTGIMDLNPLGNLTNLKDLNLARNTISDITPIANLNLLTLDLRNNNIGNDDIANIVSIESLLDLDLSRNSISDISLIVNTNPSNLLMLDVRDNPIQSIGLVYPKLYRKLDMFNAYPGNYIGDVNGDNQITSEDTSMVSSILTYLDMGVAYLPLPDNIAYIDMDNNNEIDGNDILMLSDMESSGPGGLLDFPCDDCYIKGDADGDGRVTQDDADFLNALDPGKAVLLENDRFTYNNGSYLLDGMSIGEIRNNAIRREPPEVSCITAEPGVISIITYDYDVGRWDLPPGAGPIEGHEPLDIPEEITDTFHTDILTNPFLSQTDVILPPEFAYSNRDNPVMVNYENPGYVIVNNNSIVKKVKELMQLAVTYQVYIIVPLAEKKIYIVDNTECIVLWNSTIVINKQGDIEYIRRKTWDTAYCDPDLSDSVSALCQLDKVASYGVMNMESKRGDTFNAIMMICSEANHQPAPGELVAKIIEAGVETGKPTIDLFLFPAGLEEPWFAGNDSMKRLQYNAYNHASIYLDEMFQIYGMTSGYENYVDYIAFAGFQECNQGVYKMDKGPLEYIYTNIVDDSGFIFSRIKLIRSE